MSGLDTEYTAFFEELLCRDGETLANYAHFFDFRPAHVKRAEFNRSRKKLLSYLIKRDGWLCQLGLIDERNLAAGCQVDHLIPLSTNVLNIKIKKTRPAPGRKVASESFGSNDPDNLVIACKFCNGRKKHNFLKTSEMHRILCLRNSASRFYKNSMGTAGQFPVSPAALCNLSMAKRVA
mgnify:CR=1 FL=1